MATVDQLVIEIKAETGKLKKELTKVNKSLGKTEKTAKKAGAGFAKMGKLLAAVGGVAVLRNVVNTIRTFEDLEATLRAVTGSAEAAAESFKLIRAFTSQTTFQIEEVAEAFITLKQAGIVPTSDVLQDFGNFAAGMGRSITQLARAAFNATTGEMEMLKQFGVIARQQGDKITVTFDGTTKTIERSGESIVKFLRSIGSENFSTAIEERFNTLSGAIANLQDEISEFNVAIGEGGLTENLVDLTKTFTSLLRTLRPVGEVIGGLFGSFLEGVEIILRLIDGIFLLIQSIFNLKIIDVVKGLFDDSIKTFKDFANVVRGSGDDLEDLDKNIKNMIPTVKKFTDGFNADEKKQFQVFDLLKKKINDARINIKTLVENDFASMVAIIEKTAVAKLRLEMQQNPMNFGEIRGRGDQAHFRPSQAMQNKRLQEIRKELMGGMSLEQFKAQVSEFLTETEKVETAMVSMQMAVVSSAQEFTSSFVEALLNGENALQSFRDFSKNIVSQIITIFLQMEVVNRILAAVFPSLGIQYGGIMTPAGGGTSISGSTGAGGRAGGGKVQKGVPTLVGERGAEIFVPNTGGTVMNNMNSRGMGGGTTVVVNQSVNFATGVVPTVRAEVQKMMPMISDVTKGAVLEAAVRGGSFKKGLMGSG